MSQKKTFILPDLGEGLPDATIVEWFVKVGDVIRLDEPLVSMETAKAVVEVPSPYSGKVVRLAGAGGDIIVTGTMLAEVELDPNLPQRAEAQDTGHHHGPSHAAHGAGSPAPDDGDQVVASDEGGQIQESDQTVARASVGDTHKREADAGTVVGAMQSSDAVRSEQASSVGGVKAVPAVRALAKKLKIDLTRVKATGAEGVITLKDVKDAAAGGAAASLPSPSGRGVGGEGQENRGVHARTSPSSGAAAPPSPGGRRDGRRRVRHAPGNRDGFQ
jgi:2-oxoisovalerate dehydrogenase E2 component (dihydrolipoyl transacylase)